MVYIFSVNSRHSMLNLLRRIYSRSATSANTLPESASNLLIIIKNQETRQNPKGRFTVRFSKEIDLDGDKWK